MRLTVRQSTTCIGCLQKCVSSREGKDVTAIADFGRACYTQAMYKAKCLSMHCLTAKNVASKSLSNSIPTVSRCKSTSQKQVSSKRSPEVGKELFNNPAPTRKRSASIEYPNIRETARRRLSHEVAISAGCDRKSPQTTTQSPPAEPALMHILQKFEITCLLARNRAQISTVRSVNQNCDLHMDE